MIRPDQIPDEVVEAAAKADYEAWRDRHAMRGDTLDWEDIEPDAQEDHRAGVRVSIAAALNAWPRMQVRLNYFQPTEEIILPLPAGDGQ